LRKIVVRGAAGHASGIEKGQAKVDENKTLGTVVDNLPRPRQSRSLQTQEGFIEAGWAIVREQAWESISVTDIAKRAKRSVGVFYQRFGSKEDFLSVLLHRWIESSFADPIFDRDWASADALIDGYLADTFTRIRDNRFLWRAALQRALDDTKSWEPFRELAAARRERLREGIARLRGRELNEGELKRLALALQVFNSMINNALLNNPGPLKVEDPEFLPMMRGLFRTVSQLD
jgi:AcrR family transcriptional regulator